MTIKPFKIVAIAALAASASGVAEAARVDNVNVVRVRAYNDGNAHIDLSQPLSATCGTRLRIPANKGQDNVMKIALSALMSGNLVTVDSANAKSGNFCNINFIWIHRK